MDFITSIITPITVGFFSAVLGSFVALSKFKKEKLWERKEKAYIEIIDSLYHLLQHCEIHKEDYGQGTGLSQEKENQLRKNYNNSFWKIKKATDIGAFVISSKAHDVLTELRNRETLDWESNPKFDIYELEYQYYQTALNNIVTIAKTELNAEKI